MELGDRRTPDGVTHSSFTFTAATVTATGFNPATEHLTVDADVSKTNLQILVLGEQTAEGTGYFPNTTGGKTGAPQTFAAGSAIPITVRVVDDYWNLIESPNLGQVTVFVKANDPNITNPLVNGAATSGGLLTRRSSWSRPTRRRVGRSSPLERPAARRSILICHRRYRFQPPVYRSCKSWCRAKARTQVARRPMGKSEPLRSGLPVSNLQSPSVRSAHSMRSITRVHGRPCQY